MKTNVMTFLAKVCNRPWYPILLFLLAALDIFLVVIPTDGILIASTLLQAKHWLRFALFTAVGSTLGGVLLAGLLEKYEHAIFNYFFPGIEQTEMWQYFIGLFEQWGLLVLFLNSASPFAQQPGIIITALAEISLEKIGIVMLCGRLIKQVFLGYVTVKAPSLLNRLWGIRKELDDIKKS